jgi:hypothetical protein
VVGLVGELRLERLALGDVVGHAHHRLARAEPLEARHAEAHPARLAVLAQHARLDRRAAAAAGVDLAHGLARAVRVLGRREVAGAAADDLLRVVAEEALERRVHVAHHAVHVEHDDADGGAVEQVAEARLARPQQVGGHHPLGDVAERHHAAQHHALGSAQRRDGALDERRPVAPPAAPRLVAEHGLLAREGARPGAAGRRPVGGDLDAPAPGGPPPSRAARP